ncbi:hypothetical protein JT358_05875 [Micrococcales bacterium 31B]|nr:hypothetical protein [Micrococcales bacterium 31B]
MFTRTHQPTRRGTAAALLLSVSLLTGCTQDQPLVREGGYGGTDPTTSATSGPDAPATSPSDTSTPGAGASSATSADADTGIIPTGLPAPGSTWRPPSPGPQDLAYYKSATAAGYVLELRDPATFPPKMPAMEPPFMDADGQTRTEMGAITIAYYYFNAVNYYVATGDTQPLDYVSTSDCETCAKELQVLDPIFKSDGYAVASKIRVSDLIVVERRDTGYTLQGEVVFPAVETYIPKNSAYLKTPERSGTYKIDVEWSEAGRFLITNYGKVEPETGSQK